MRTEVFAVKSKPRKRRERRPSGAEEIASARECTGLVAARPQSREEEERLSKLYRVHEPN